MNHNVAMKLNFDAYRDKVYACWIGKNIGGTMGGPYEGTHEILDIKGYKTEANVVLPNDDLDLQLIWLHAVERIGARAVNANTLGEFWLSYLPPHWNEYGIGKINMQKGLIPPLAGDYHNHWKHSNGAWIRTEVWACMAPASPAIAAKYAIEDAKVDHGAGEGTYAAAFVAAMQSSAFVVKDLRRCIEIGLDFIPDDCRMSDSIRFAIECYEKGIPAMEARNLIQQRNADIGNGWFEAPSNVAYAILGLLYGEGDFKKSMITAINCGDDTDCTAATVGATMGILYGTAGIPKDWQTHIGDDIITISINRGGMGNQVPKTCTELTCRVVEQAPHMLFENDAYVGFTDGADEIPENLDAVLFNSEYKRQKKSLANLKPHTMHFDFTFASVDVTLDSDADIAPMGERQVHVEIGNNWKAYDRGYYNLTLRWITPDGFTVEGGRQTARLENPCSAHKVMPSLDFTIKAGERVAPVNRIVLEIVGEGRITPMYIPIVLLG